MPHDFADRSKRWAVVPPWIILCLVIILAAVVATMAARNTNREKTLATQTLLEKGAAIIRAFASGARFGMGMRWEGPQFQALLEEMAKEPGILYLVVTDAEGRILADSDRAMIGRALHTPQTMARLKPGTKEQWHLVTKAPGTRVFEVYSDFAPLVGTGTGAGASMTGMWCAMDAGSPGSGAASSGMAGGGHGMVGDGHGMEAATRQIMFVGFDVAPFQEALAEDFRNTLVLSAVLFLVGVGGVMTLFWAQNARISKRQLADTRALHAEIVSNLPVGLVTTGGDGRVTVVNEAAQRIAAITAVDALGKPLPEVFPTELCALQEIIAGGEPVLEREMECTFGASRDVPLSVSASRIKNDQGDVLGSIFILRDLGEVRRLQDTVRRKEKLAALGSLAAGIAHEIRNPLSSIKGFAKYFEEQSAEGSQGRELAGVMAKEVDRLNRVITELLEFAKPSDLKTRPTRLADVVSHSLRLIRQDAESRHIRVVTEAEPDLPPVDLDPDRLTQALLNLYLNAIQAMNGGGTLTVTAGPDGPAGVRLEVADTGPGIAPENLEHIFNPYFTTKTSGTGLGLAIVHKVIEAHGGSIKVRSQPGRGTVFRVRIPNHPGQGGAGHDRQA